MRLRGRDVNLALVLQLLLQRRRSTRTELGRLSGLSKATVSVIVSDLVGQGFATPVGSQQQGRGRSRTVLEFNPRARTVIGAQVQDDVCTAVLTDLDGHVYQQAESELRGADVGAVVEAVIQAVECVRDTAESPILGLGVGVPGDVDRDGRQIMSAVSHGWSDVPIADVLEERLGLPVVAANRAKVAALGQLEAGERSRAYDLIYIYLGSGVIAGLVIGGQLCSGRNGGAGDIGHVTVQPNGALCGCGNRGCLHTVASEQAILALGRAYARQAEPSCLLRTLTDGHLARLTLPVIGEAVHQADATAVRMVEEVGTWLGIVAGNLVTTLNPDAVVLGGPTTVLGEPLLKAIRAEVESRAVTEASDKLDITFSQRGNASGAAGAASLWISRVLDPSAPLMLLASHRQDGTT